MPDPTLIAARYEVIRPLGRGGFGETILARDRSLNRQVAIKILRPGSTGDFKAYELFEREAEVLGALRHPGIPAVHEALRAEWEGADSACLVMEYVEGRSLAAMMGERRFLDPDDVRQLFLKLLDVLEFLHSRMPPILHRDIKPANVIVRPDGSPVLVDFGAVRNVFKRPDESGSTVVGTYGYMPYEQYMGRATPASDLYALAATFLHVMTGRPPAEFMSESGRVEVPDHLPTGEPFRSVLARLLSPTPSERYQSAELVRQALQPGAAIVAVGAKAPVALPPTPRALTGETKAQLKRSAYSWLDLAMSDERASPGLMDVILLTFFSIVSFGIVPAVLAARAAARKRRLKPFFKDGLIVSARVIEMADEKLEFDVKMKRVRYAFQADGQRRIGTDRVLWSITERWEVGSEITVLYLPHLDYDSVIVAPAR